VAAPLRRAGPALGILPEAAFPELDLCLPSGAVFCAYTDGLVDRHNDPTSSDGQRLQRVAAQAFDRLTGDDPRRPATTLTLAEDIVRGMLGGAAPDDDICLVVVRAGADGG
jgi:serine phosphatase RsbU (regulator of sigma subunit)